MKPFKLTLTFNPNLLWRKKMKYSSVLLLTLVPLLALAQSGNYYEPVDYTTLNWPKYHRDGKGDPGNDVKDTINWEHVECPSIDIREQDFFVDMIYNIFIGSIELESGQIASDSVWTCYEFYFDKDHYMYPEENEGDTTFWAQRGINFRPETRIRFCGKNGQILEERFQYWDGQQWIGDAQADDPRIRSIIFTEFNKTNGLLNFEFKNLLSFGITPPIITRDIVPVTGCWITYQGEYLDYLAAGYADIGQHYLVVDNTTWQEIKQQGLKEGKDAK
jgi:hypothetical protein